MGLADARKRAAARAATANAPFALQQQKADAYAVLIEQVDPLIQGVRRAIKRRGYARLTLMQRLVHRNAYGSLQIQPPFEKFTSTRHFKGELYWDVRAGRKFLRVFADGLILIGLNTNEWYLRCARWCECQDRSSPVHERHMIVTASNAADYVDIEYRADLHVLCERAEEWIALCTQTLGIPDDEVEG